MPSVLVCIPVPKRSGTEGSGPGRVYRNKGRERAIEVVNLRTKTLRLGKGALLVLITEAEVGTEYLPSTFQGSCCYDMKQNYVHKAH